jgi:BirA family biotin operon repressor/biotin-[acetyl-CoA-carboxylase] ligase
MQLDPAAARAGYRLAAHDELGSTNAEAMRLARAGERGPLWVTAQKQTAGRGRRDNVWVSAPGNLFATLLLTDPAPRGKGAELSFVTAVAVLEAIAAAAPAVRDTLALKWPNDVLSSGRKIAGILIEAEGDHVAIGIGINCISHPDTAFPATDLAAAGALVSADEVFSALSATMAERLALWDRGAGFAAIRQVWLSHAAGLGGAIKVRLPERETSGIFLGLDETGRLLLESASGTVETITAGEVFGLPSGR